jgi:NADH:ubiquinone oxidoreductase subunit 3 (subunit A)
VDYQDFFKYTESISFFLIFSFTNMLFFSEYVILFYYFCFLLIFVFLLLSVSFFLVKQNPSAEKLSSYECGFNPYDDARLKFEVRFFIVGILFIVFDLELLCYYLL